MNPPTAVADTLFDAERVLAKAEESLCDFLDGVFGKTGWEDYAYDVYDRSVEVFGVPLGVQLSGDGLTMFRVAGFDRVWLHAHLTEKRMPGERFYGIK